MMEPSERLEENHATNLPTWRQLSVFFCTGKNRVVKITHSSFEMVLRTTKHTMIYPISGPSLKVIALRSVV
jgi:hypothetical protein